MEEQSKPTHKGLKKFRGPGKRLLKECGNCGCKRYNHCTCERKK
jgi:hypothetical protein